MAHAQTTDFVFRRNKRVHLNRRGRQFSRLLAAEVCASAVVMLDTPCSEVVRRVLANHSIRQFPLHFPSRASACAITFQLDSTLSYKQLHVSASILVIFRLYCFLLYSNYTVYNVSVADDEISFTKVWSMGWLTKLQPSCTTLNVVIESTLYLYH